MATQSGNLINGRCYMVPVVETLVELKQKMVRRHWELLRSTPFAHLMDMEPIIQERGVLDALMQLFDARTNRFRIGDGLLSFRQEDVALIVGLRASGTVVEFTRLKEACSLEKTYLDKGCDRNKESVARNLRRLVLSRSREDEENFVKLLVVYIMGMILFPNTNNSVPVWLAQYANNLPGLGQYSWAHATHKWLMDDVPEAASRVRARCAGQAVHTGYLRGCVIALNVWFYELTGTGKKIHVGKIPRILCYGANSYKKKGAVGPLIESLKGKEVVPLI